MGLITYIQRCWFILKTWYTCGNYNSDFSTRHPYTPRDPSKIRIVYASDDVYGYRVRASAAKKEGHEITYFDITLKYNNMIPILDGHIEKIMVTSNVFKTFIGHVERFKMKIPLPIHLKISSKIRALTDQDLDEHSKKRIINYIITTIRNEISGKYVTFPYRDHQDVCGWR